MNKIEYIHKDTKTCEPLITAIELSKENIKFYGNTEEEKDKEIERLNNIIDELEKWIKEDKEYAMNNFECGRCFNMFDILNKLKELKEGK